MSLTDLNHMLAHAYHHGYAVGAFAVHDLESLSGVMAAAEASRAPVLLTPDTADESHWEMLLPAMEAAARRALVPVAIQMAVTADPEVTARAIRLGCNGVRLTTREDSFPRSVQQVQAAAALARDCGVASEAAPSPDTVSTPAEAKGFVERSGVAGLRLDLGPVQSETNGSRKGRVDYSRLKQVHQSLGIPLSVDAGNDLTEDQYRRLIRHGVAAIGYRIRLAEVAGERIRDNCSTDADAMAGISDAVAAEAEQHMRSWGSAGRAAEVLAQCAPWQPAEQLLLCNFGEATEGDMETILARGEELLGGIPGVREAVGGAVVAEDASYRYAWRVRLCHPQALASFEAHPDRAAFANGRLHPEAQGCLSIPYRHLGGGPATSQPVPATPAETPTGKVPPLDNSNQRDLA
ncbi:class II fructose-bisphosphate aldolase [Thiohalorhabdus sp.]|uniref:class II fructose-bisphosphate aldolase n=1 Tax=Thiohalorhabdus sp. TaxID=3094134 RepID=UPI002FC2D751